MSKYIKLEDAIHNINHEVTGRKEYTGDMKANLFFALDDLPTIEVSEEAIKATKKFNCYTIADENAEMGMRTQIEPIIEVSEDCISRGWLEQEIENISVESKFEDEHPETRGWNNALDTVVAIIGNAPSVVTSRAEGEWSYIDEPIIGNPYGRYRCSECELEEPHKTDFCPNCGAKMKGESE